MPQIVEVVKYITEICEAENSLIAGVHVDILEQEKQYKELYGVSRKQLLSLWNMMSILEFGTEGCADMIVMYLFNVTEAKG